MATGGVAEQWYVVHTKPKQERRAEENLNAWGLATLAPQLRERHGSARNPLGFRIAPLFPRYVFARFDLSAHLAKVRMTRGVHDVVRFGGSVTAVTDDVIALLREKIQADGFVRVGDPVRGDLVRIESGPFRSIVGVFEREMRGQDRVLVLLSALGAQTRVQLPRSFVRKVPLNSVA